MNIEEQHATSGMQTFCSMVFGLIGVVAGRVVVGLDWTAAAFLFFPFYGLVAGLFNNEGQRITRNAVLLVLFPVVTMCARVYSAKAIAAVAEKGGAAHASAVFLLVSVGVGFCVFLVASLVANIIGRVMGDYRLPRAVHSVAVKLLAASAYILAMLAVLLAFRKIEAVAAIPRMTASGVRILLAISFAFAFRRLLSFDVARLERGPARNAGGGKAVSGTRLPSVPDTRLSDVVGMREVKDQIRLRLVEPVRDRARAMKYGLKVGGGMLLYGPPGTGKTMLARAVAGELGLPFYSITPADVFGKYVGESERNIRAIFAEARKSRLSVVFIDEMETLFPKRTDDSHETTRKVVSVILQELDGIDKSKNPMLLVGATNVPWMVDEAFLRPGRFDVKVFVGLPDEEARAALVGRALDEGSVPCEKGLAAYVAKNTANYSGADLNGVVGAMRQMAYDGRLPRFTREVADRAIATTSPSAAGDMLDRIREWESENLPANSDNSGSVGVKLASRPDTTLEDVAGMEDVKLQIRLRLIDPIRNRTLTDMYGLKPGGGVLLYGPPGTGKTMLARAVAGELGLPFYAVTAADVFGKYVGDSERNLRRIFRDARRNELSVVFMDELEALVPKRVMDTNEVSRKVVSVLLQELDGIDQRKNPILLIGATNVPWMVDEAFLRPGRLDVRVYVGLPDAAARAHMFSTGLGQCRIPCEEGLPMYMAEKSEGYSGADIRGVVERMRQLSYIRRAPMFDSGLADEALAEVRPSANGDIVRRIREWESSIS